MILELRSLAKGTLRVLIKYDLILPHDLGVKGAEVILIALILLRILKETCL